MSTGELCKIITDLGGDPATLSDKTAKTLSEEIIRLLSIGSALELDAADISYETTTVDGQLDTLVSKVTTLESEMDAEQARTPTSAEVLSAIESMTTEQVAAVNAKLSAQ